MAEGQDKTPGSVQTDVGGGMIIEKTWECKICKHQYTDREKGYGTKCWQGHLLTKISLSRPHLTKLEDDIIDKMVLEVINQA